MRAVRDARARRRHADPILIGHGYWRFAAPPELTGLWGMLHETRTDFTVWPSCAFLFLAGAGPCSIDARLGSGRKGCS